MPDPCLYTYEQIRSIAQAAGVPDYDTRDIRELGMYLYTNGMITQEMLQTRQNYFRANGELPPM